MFGTRTSPDMVSENQEALAANASDHPFDFDEFWTRTTVGGGASNKVFGWDLTWETDNNWRPWNISEMKPILPALLLSQVGEDPILQQ